MTIDAIREACQAGEWAMTEHARIRAGRRRILDEELVASLAGGEVLENYPDDPRGPSALILGHANDGRAIHAVCAFDPSGTLLIITTYEPGLPRWIDERTRGGTGER
jgi:hypothetical protein